MNDARLKVIQDRVHPLFDAWVERLRLQAWKINLDWHRTGGVENHNGGQCIMEVECDWRYMEARVSIFANTAEGLDDLTLEDAVIHELIHIHLSEMSPRTDSERDHEERVVTSLTRAFHQMHLGSLPMIEDTEDDEDSSDGSCGEIPEDI